MTHNDEIETGFDDAQAMQEVAAQREREAAQARLATLGQHLMSEFHEAERARALFEQRWLDDLMQYRGQYTPQVRKRLQKTRRSQVFYRMTTAKVDTMTARLMDLLFPSRSKNWHIDPTPAPTLPEEVVLEAVKPELEARTAELLQQTMAELQAANTVPDELALQKLQAGAKQQALSEMDLTPVRLKLARERAAAMETVIDDQLKEAVAGGQCRPSWQQNCKSVVKSACLYGMGILKGPLVERRITKRRIPVPGEGNTVVWQEQEVGEELHPYHEAVSIWNVYPDPGAMKPSELRFVWQLHLMTDKDLWELTTFPGFDGHRISRHLREHQEGDAVLRQWESELRMLNENAVTGGKLMERRYRVYERWGYLTGQELRDAGNEVAEEDLPKVFSSNVWILGDQVVKAVINPLEGVDIPYYFYPFREDETSFWPEGIASAVRHPQAGINASVRATQDNAALSSGPIIGVNVAALSEGEDPTDMEARRLFLFDRASINLDQALRVFTVPSCIEHNLTLIKFWQEAADEMSTPRFNAGDGRISGAGNTASGLSMLMGASNILLKDHIKDFDDCISAPFIRAMFHWNMQWNPREDIKGDFEVSATGSQSLIAKEVRAQQVPGIISLLANPAFAPRIKEDELLKVALEQTDLPSERLLRTDAEATAYQQQQMEMAAQAQAQASAQALADQLQKQGMPPEQIQAQLLALLAQQHPSGAGGETPAGVPQQ